MIGLDSSRSRDPALARTGRRLLPPSLTVEAGASRAACSEAAASEQEPKPRDSFAPLTLTPATRSRNLAAQSNALALLRKGDDSAWCLHKRNQRYRLNFSRVDHGNRPLKIRLIQQMGDSPGFRMVSLESHERNG